jgi:hypothetical protein
LSAVVLSEFVLSEVVLSEFVGTKWFPLHARVIYRIYIRTL